MTDKVVTVSEQEIARLIRETAMKVRDDALSDLLELCQGMAANGHSADCCVAAIRDFKSALANQ